MAKKRTTRYVKRTITVDIYAAVKQSISDEDAITQANEACEAITGTYSTGRISDGPDGLEMDSVEAGVRVFFDPESIEYEPFLGGEIVTEDDLP